MTTIKLLAHWARKPLALLCAFCLTTGMAYAHGGGGGHSGGSHSGGSHSGGSHSGGSHYGGSHYGSYPHYGISLGYNSYPYGYNSYPYGYSSYPYNYVVPQNVIVVPSYAPTYVDPVISAPVVVNPPATASVAPLGDPQGTITIWNPADSGGAVNFTFQGEQVALQPGQTRTMQNSKRWVVAFGSGGSAGDIRYTLAPGTYKFKVSPAGWNLYKTVDVPPNPNVPGDGPPPAGGLPLAPPPPPPPAP